MGVLLLMQYTPLYIKGMEQGLIQSRQEFILPNDAYPVLENAFVWRERIKRKQGYEFLAGDVNKSRLRRIIPAGTSIGTTGVSPWTFNIFTAASVGAGEINKELQVGSVVIIIGGAITLTDQGNGTLTSVTPGNSGTINYSSGSITLTHTAGAGVATTATFNYFPSLPVMGLRTRELNNINSEDTIAFDTVYAYRYINGWQEFIPGFTWTGTDSDFFWTTNYWVTPPPPNGNNNKVFWETNGSGSTGDPIRYTDGTTWINFAPPINAAGDRLENCLAMLPFRSRLIAFNTWEGANLAGSVNYRQRIRWAAIGNPISDVSTLFPIGTVNANAWRDDIPGQGGFLDIPTAQDIISVGFVRDNLVIYCEQSTWQLRYTGRSIAPFQIEKVNSELGSESTFSAVQFDTSLVGIGDKGIVECDSFQSQRIDIKIPDLIFQFNNLNDGPKRVHGIRDFVQRLAFWTYPYVPDADVSSDTLIYPNRRLVYNYENGSWAIFTDSLTTLGTFQAPTPRTWAQSTFPWSQANFPWFNRPDGIPDIIGGNQQGFTLYLDSQVSNDASLTITGITGNTSTPTVINSINHNMSTGTVISITDIPLGTPFASTLNNPLQGLITGATQANPCQITSTAHNLATGDRVEISGVVGMTELNNGVYTIIVTGVNTFTLDVDSTAFTPYVSGGVWTKQSVNAFSIVVVDKDNFQLWKYNSSTQEFSDPQLDVPATYIGGGKIRIRDNFSVISKKFNYLDQGQMIQLGFVDVLLDNTSSGAISLYVYQNYNDDEPINILPQNIDSSTNQSDTFFNQVVPTYNEGGIESLKNIKRVYCSTRGAFLTLEWTLSNAQMVGIEQESEVQIDMQILWLRTAGNQINAGV